MTGFAGETEFWHPTRTSAPARRWGDGGENRLPGDNLVGSQANQAPPDLPPRGVPGGRDLAPPNPGLAPVNEAGASYTLLGDLVGLTRQRVGHIVAGD
jgi:hypothetical protein